MSAFKGWRKVAPFARLARFPLAAGNYVVTRGLCSTTAQLDSSRSSTVMSSRNVSFNGVARHTIRKGVTFYANDSVVNPVAAGPPDQPRPLLLLLPWLGSKPHALAKYCEIYLKTGFDVLAVETEVGRFLWPRWGLEYGGQLLELLESERFAQRPLLVHAFSIGGYTFAQILIHIARDPQRYQGLTSRIKGQIYDSLVVGSLERMAIGVSRNLFPRWGPVVKHVSLLYFYMFKRQTVDYFNMGIDAFKKTPVPAPALFFYCNNDALCDPEALEEMLEQWDKLGISVTSKKWVESIHAGHLRAHPQEYMSILKNFLYSLNMVPLKAKL
ncbi:transmembrane protein 53 isoform X1 [Astyanax mexicanus]|uniref:transmembrane protein 53 isoform X1 n=2 Tax=Astyanax mexicanus TaxID=7994 RepID=UPI0020CB2EE3|nr:transmembrane protein 53 isoform X1 [Astyanax mexicanus]